MTERDYYRQSLIEAEQKAQGDYDKTIISLSGGALALSIVFIKDIVGGETPVSVWAVVFAWVAWLSSLTCVVSSYFSSIFALRNARDQHDKDDFSGGVGGHATKVTHILNGFSGLLFVVGLIFIVIFASHNVGGNAMNNSSGSGIQKPGTIPPPPPPPKAQPDSSPPRPLTEGVIPPPPPRPSTNK